MKNKETFYLKALEYSTSGNVSNAIELIDQILEIDPHYGKAHYLKGWILFDYMDDLDRAKEHIKKAIIYDPENPQSYYLYCDILIEERNIEELKSISEKLTKLNIIDKAYLYHKLACAYETRNQYIDAISTLNISRDFGSSSDWLSFVDNEINRIRRKVRAA